MSVSFTSPVVPNTNLNNNTNTGVHMNNPSNVAPVAPVAQPIQQQVVQQPAEEIQLSVAYHRNLVDPNGKYENTDTGEVQPLFIKNEDGSFKQEEIDTDQKALQLGDSITVIGFGSIVNVNPALALTKIQNLKDQIETLSNGQLTYAPISIAVPNPYLGGARVYVSKPTATNYGGSLVGWVAKKTMNRASI